MRSRPEEIHELLPILALEESCANGCWPLLAVPSLLVGMDGDKRCPDLIGELHPRKRPASCAAARASTGARLPLAEFRITTCEKGTVVFLAIGRNARE